MKRIITGTSKPTKLCMPKHFWLTGTAVGFSFFSLIFALFFRSLTWLAPCGVFGVLASVFIMLGYGITTVKIVPLEETKDYVKAMYGKNYAMGIEIERRRKNIMHLEREQEKTVKFFVIGALATCAGIALVAWRFPFLKLELFAIFYGYVYLAYVTIIIGIVLIVVGVRAFWYALVNSNFAMGRFLSTTFSIDTIPDLIEKEYVFIGILSKRMDRERDLTNNE